LPISTAFPTDPDASTFSRSLRDIATGAARSVGAPLLAAFRSPMVLDTKVDFHDLVTIHDRQTEVALKAFIGERVPGSRFIGEEGGTSGEGPIDWYIDPIDGTANFAAGLAFWCVSIGAVVDGKIVAGVVFDPVTGNLFSADRSGAWLNGEVLHSRARPTENEAMVITSYPVERDFRLDGRARALDNFATLAERFSTVRRPGSAALSLCHVAAGWCDAAIGFGVNAWDVSAAILILRQAGGRYDAYGLGKVEPGAADFQCPGYVAVGAGGDYPTLGAIAGAVAAHRKQSGAYRAPGIQANAES
jgi:myo-inositol-1(or 4)-monophosphatase